MNNIIRDFPSRLIIKIANLIMLDSEINKMLYYNKVNDKDIYSLDDVVNPIGVLKDNKVFMDRRIDKVWKESDISVFVNLSKDAPYSRNYTKSNKIRTVEVEIGVICHNNCRKTINGFRDSAVFNRIKMVLCEDESVQGLKGIRWGETTQMYNMPQDYMGYSTKILVDYFGKM